MLKNILGEVVKTGAGSLNCNMIIHVATPYDDLKKLKEIVGKALQLAEKEGCKSIAFPALGTGKRRIFVTTLIFKNDS